MKKEVGDKNNGFDVLYHNMKYGYVAAKELAEFFRERSLVEETHSKLLSKLARQASSACTLGTFGPLWIVLRVTSEKLSSLHAQMVAQLQDLVKEVQRYCEEQHKRHKQVKEEESPTLEVVTGLQHTTGVLAKAREAYVARCLELDKLRKEASPRDLDKAEAKARKACEEYRQLVERHGTVRADFERRMASSCERFQVLEEGHLRHMKEFLTGYARVLDSSHALVGQVHAEFRQQCDALDVEALLRQFAQARQTGSEKPEPVTFEEPDPGLQLTPAAGSAAPAPFFSTSTPVTAGSGGPENGPPGAPPPPVPLPPPEVTPPPCNGPQPSTKKEGFLRTKWERQKEKRKRKKESLRDTVGSGGEAVRGAPGRGVAATHRASPSCERRLSIEQSRAADPDSLGAAPAPAPVPTTARDSKEAGEQVSFVHGANRSVRGQRLERPSFAERPDEEERNRRIHIEIKPLSNGAPMSASVDELRATIGSLSLSPIPQHSTRRAYNSATSTPDEAPRRPANQVSKDSGGGSGTDPDMLGLFPSDSSASTPTTVFQSPPSGGRDSVGPTSSGNAAFWDRYAALSELFSEKASGDMSGPEAGKAGTAGSRGGTPTSAFGVGPALPRPPSRRSEAATRGRASPLPMSRTESVGSLSSSDFKTTPVPFGCSRGPSPLTIGVSDSIPLAVAFQEVVHARFKGADEARCQVKLLGDMKVSFPAGIVHVLANHPAPATLAFRVHTARFDNVLPNKNLISLDASQSTSERCVYEFNMSLLTGLLRRQHEQTPSASYFNIDILKYHVRAGPGARSAPLHLVAYWKTQEDNTDLKAPADGALLGVPVAGARHGSWSPPASGTRQPAGPASGPKSGDGEGGRGGSLLSAFPPRGALHPKPLEARFLCEGATLSSATSSSSARLPSLPSQAPGHVR
ncbi:proline-serine-threonine phosphatase interacting protein, putative [Ixodes scapularis]|uniref:Proline-serine-threonine phosphatase interacting protein, putative n=1 Tax=Ixodes scapularis TaxID=6945 RepID=B7PUD9_IXOSC|nr:proline-serine-threonine phosphatase interacting protein, putative [Ixodes scapularis]|eukprot:XP_002405961.1 proline-serine-threonine phosphatase interacting protein, putative [Ixodes scapularis]